MKLHPPFLRVLLLLLFTNNVLSVEPPIEYELFDLNWNEPTVVPNSEPPVADETSSEWPKPFPTSINFGQVTVVESSPTASRALKMQPSSGGHLAQIGLFAFSPLYFFDAYRVQFQFSFHELAQAGSFDDFAIHFDGSGVFSLRLLVTGEARLSHQTFDPELGRKVIRELVLTTFDPSGPLACQFEFDQSKGTAALTINGTEVEASGLFTGVNEKWGFGIVNFRPTAFLYQARVSFGGEAAAGVLLETFRLAGLGRPTPQIVSEDFVVPDYPDYVKIPLTPPIAQDWLVQYSPDFERWETISGTVSQNHSSPFFIILPTGASSCGWARTIPAPEN